MTKVGAFLAGLALAAAAAGAAWWFLVEPHRRDAEERATLAERASQRAKRDVSDAQQWAESERRRKQELEDEVTALKRALSAEPPREPKKGGHGDAAKPAADDLQPEQWDGRRLRQEIDVLSAVTGGGIGTPRFARVVRALKAHQDEGLDLVATVLGSELPVEMRSACANLLGALEDPRGAKPLLAAWGSANDAGLRRCVLRGLANVPGDEATPILAGVWNEPATDAESRALAIHGLARRRHAIALAVAEGGAPGSTPPLRLQALQTLHGQAMKDGWKDASVAALFGRVLRSADGDAQRKLALLALEGYWSADSVAVLDAFAEAAGTSDLAVRARKAADAIRAGKPRPEGAGVPAPRPGATPADAEPAAPPSAPEPPK